MKIKTALVIIGIYIIISSYILIKGDTDPLIHISERLERFKKRLPTEVRTKFDSKDYKGATSALEEIHTKALLYKIAWAIVEHKKKSGKLVDKVSLLEDELPFAISYRNPVNNKPIKIEVSEDKKDAIVIATFEKRKPIKLNVSNLSSFKSYYEKMKKIDAVKDEEGINIFPPKDVIAFFKEYFVDKIEKK